MKDIVQFIKESEGFIEQLSDGYEIFYDNKVEKKNGNVQGLQLSKHYYAELRKDGKRIDWVYSEADAKDEFDSKIQEWKKKYEKS